MEKFLKEQVGLSSKESKQLEAGSYGKMMNYVFESAQCDRETQESFKDMLRSSIELTIPKDVRNGFYMHINNGEDPDVYGYEEIEFKFDQHFDIIGAELYKRTHS